MIIGRISSVVIKKHLEISNHEPVLLLCSVYEYLIRYISRYSRRDIKRGSKKLLHEGINIIIIIIEDLIIFNTDLSASHNNYTIYFDF